MKKQNIVIVGGGTAGWICAAVLAKGLPQSKHEIQLVESNELPSVGVGEATIPPIVLLLQYLGIEQTSFLEKVNGTYKYGIHFEGWSKEDESYMHAFGELGTPANGIEFPELWLKCRSNLSIDRFNDFSPSAIAAYENKFHPAIALPSTANSSHFYPLSGLHYAFQFDAKKLVSVLSEYACKKNVKPIIGTVEKIFNNAQGDIQHLRLTDKSIIEGDIFIDCSGMHGLLNQQHFGCKYQDWQQFLPCDRAIPMQTEALDPLPPYTKSIAMNAGWRWQIPLRTRTGNGYVYSSQFSTDEQAIDEINQALSDQKKLTEPRILKFRTGCLEKPWYRNSIAIGLSSGFFEPLESTSIHLIHKFAIEIKNALENGKHGEQEAEQFNADFQRTSVQIRDFLVTHYHINQRQNSPFWQHCRQMPIPSTLSHLLDEFSKTGKITLPEDSLFTYENYLQVLLGQGYISDYGNFADVKLNLDGAAFFFKNVREAIASEVGKLQSHASYLKQHSG